MDQPKDQTSKKIPTIPCPSCKDDVKVTLRDSDTIKKIVTEDGDVIKPDPNFNAKISSSRVSEFMTICHECNNAIKILKS